MTHTANTRGFNLSESVTDFLPLALVVQLTHPTNPTLTHEGHSKMQTMDHNTSFIWEPPQCIKELVRLLINQLAYQSIHYNSLSSAQLDG